MSSPAEARSARLRRIARDGAAAVALMKRLRVDLAPFIFEQYEGQERGSQKAIDLHEVILIAFDRAQFHCQMQSDHAARCLNNTGEPIRFNRAKRQKPQAIQEEAAPLIEAFAEQAGEVYEPSSAICNL